MSFKVRDRDREGGFVKAERKNGGRESRRRKALQNSQNSQPKKFKTYEDRVAESEAAWQRWAGVLPLAAAREMITEANLPEEKMTELLAAIAQLSFEELEKAVNSGELAVILEKLTTGATLQTL